MAALLAAWQIYSGVSMVIVSLSAGVINTPAPAQIFAFVALRTVVLIVLFVLLLFVSDREKIQS